MSEFPSASLMARRASLSYWLHYNAIVLLAALIFIAMFAVYLILLPRGISTGIMVTAANKGVLLALVAAAQTFPVLTGGIDLSVGAIVIMTNCLASNYVNGNPLHIAEGCALTLICGLAGGAINALAVVVGRLQPIIATLASSTVFYGISLLFRPEPGGDVDDDFASFMTGAIGWIPISLIILCALLLLVWLPFRTSMIGRSIYAVGSAESAAYMSGIHVGRAKAASYILAGFFAAIAGLLLTLISESAQASMTNAGDLTLNSIAAVVIGGTSLFGGVGGLPGSILGAFILRTIGDLLFVLNAPALWQPLFQGLVLLAAVGLGALPLLRVRNRLEAFR
ncbi:ABC transporter permease [Kozakia baliensis]|uniref:ABC transporter permease n=1 Tax=Kozakia baliensis TaxID=153496 RepID=UPI000A7E597E|nr:ABC transporter permease [Kozakia baliensis]